MEQKIGLYGASKRQYNAKGRISVLLGSRNGLILFRYDKLQKRKHVDKESGKYIRPKILKK